MIQLTSRLLAVGTYTVAVTVGVVLFGAALLSDPLLERTPAVETLGERAITRETDDLIFVVDETETIVKCNETATETLDETPAPGDGLQAVLGQEMATLETRETISLETGAGKRRYDPQVSPITAASGNAIGAVLSLRDVTERELREQRLAVLNRVLRHNLRNKVDVVKSHAERLGDDRNDEHVAAITGAAESITDLGNRARTIDQLVSESSDISRVDVVEAVERVCGDLDLDDSVSVALEVPDSAVVETNPRALDGALTSAIDNAVTYAASAVSVAVHEHDDGVEVVVDDDGPGIPQRELDSLDAGTETPLQHGTGLGLWQLRWAVTTMGGDLSFETDEGTTVRFTVQNQATG